jgi:hypothetical protein
MTSQELVNLIGNIAWPITVVVLLIVLRRNVREILEAIRTRIADPGTPVRISRDGFELNARVDVLEGNLEVQKIRANAIALAASGGGSSDVLHGKAGSERMHELRSEYLAITGGNRSDRIRRKNSIADELGAVALRERVSKESLAREKDEIWTLALSAAATAVPEVGDDQLLLSCGRDVRRLHVRYRVAAAFAQLSASSLCNSVLRDDVLALLEVYQDGADPALKRRLDRTSSQLRIMDGPHG